MARPGPLFPGEGVLNPGAQRRLCAPSLRSPLPAPRHPGPRSNVTLRRRTGLTVSPSAFGCRLSPFFPLDQPTPPLLS